jgi:hypothetical protein
LEDEGIGVRVIERVFSAQFASQGNSDMASLPKEGR